MKKSLYKKKQETGVVNTLNTPFLIIVESPSKCPKIEKFLGFQYKCIASKGHLRELKKVSSAKNGYLPEYSIIEDKATHVSWMKSIVSQFDAKNIFLGMDDDREGEGIAWHICMICDLDVQTTKRILFHEVTAPALKRAVASPTILRMNIVKAQQARQILDRMIGFQISPVLSRLLVHDNSKFLSAGRCQTPTLRLVYDRHKEAASKKENVQYRIQGTFLSHPSTLVAQLDTYLSSEKDVCDFIEKSKTHCHVLDVLEKKIKTKQPPKPFSTSHLLQAASTQLHMSPKYVMDGCQKLYQDGKITYMRTESTKYAKGYLDQCSSYIQTQYGNEIGDLQKITNEDSNNPHEAIRVTQLDIKYVQYEDKKINDLYQLIWRRSVESCMKPYQYEEHTIHVSAPIHKYTSSLEIPLVLGWKYVTMTLSEMKLQQEKMAMTLQYYKTYKTKRVTYQKIDCSLFMRDVETYYQEAGLIQKLEALGIGRPSTFSMLVDTIQERKYVLKQDVEGEIFHGKEFTLEENIVNVREVEKIFGASKNKLRIQPLGLQAIEWLVQHCGSLFDYEYTSKMELELDEFIANPEKNWQDMCGQCETLIQKCLKPLKDKMKKSYYIDDHHELIFGKSGMMIKYQNGDEKSYKSLRSNLELDFAKIENGQYTLDELLELPNNCLGKYQGEDVVLKNGPYGAYVVWGANKQSISALTKKTSLDKIILKDVINLIEKSKEEKNTILREIDENTSVRTGKFGHYIFYKTSEMKKPKFINLKKCPYNVLKDDAKLVIKWVQETLKK